MSSIKHITINCIEARVRFTKSEQAHSQGKEGIREYTNPFICFFAVFFGFAVNVSHKGQIFCLNKNSFREWVKRNLDETPKLDAIEQLAEELILKVKLPQHFTLLKKEIEQLKGTPDFVKNLCQDRETLELFQNLKIWRKTRDVLMVWTKLANSLEVKSDFTEMNSIRGCLDRVKRFSEWFKKHENKLEKIYFLDLSGKQLKNLPKEITKLKNLEQLVLSENLLKELPHQITNLKNLEALTLTKNRLKEVPKEIFNLDNLESLYLFDNQVSFLSNRIGGLENLKKLCLSGNMLTGIPKEIGELINLTELYLADNQLKEIPKEIENLKNLWSISFSNNLLESFPEGLSELKNLWSLNLSKNHLKEIPKEIVKLENLEFLYLYQNQLEELPEELVQLSKLKYLSIKENPKLKNSNVVSKLLEKGVKIELN